MATVLEIVDRLAKEDPLYGIYRPGLGTSETRALKIVTKEKNSVPTRKIGSAALAGAVMTVVMFVLGLQDVELASEVVAAITALITAGVGYLVPESNTSE